MQSVRRVDRAPPFGGPLRGMPEIARVNGIRVSIYYDEPHGTPHFHASKGGREVVVAIQTGAVLGGGLAWNDLRKLRRWADRRRSELMEQWERARRHETLDRVT